MKSRQDLGNSDVQYPLAKYSVEWQPDDRHLLRVGNPRLFDHPYQRPQLELWPKEAVEWFVIIKAAPYGPRKRSKRATRIVVMQPPLFGEEARFRSVNVRRFFR